MCGGDGEGSGGEPRAQLGHDIGDDVRGKEVLGTEQVTMGQGRGSGMRGGGGGWATMLRIGQGEPAVSG